MGELLVVKNGKVIGPAERLQVQSLAAVAGDPSLADLSLEEFDKVMAERDRASNVVLTAGARIEQEALRLSRDGKNTLLVTLRDEEDEQAVAIRDSLIRQGFRCSDIASKTFSSTFQVSWDLYDAVNHENGHVIKNVMRTGPHLIWIE
jgi:hypothetical protein